MTTTGMADLARTTDPFILIPGDPHMIRKVASEWRARGTSCEEVARRLSAIDTRDNWRGSAGTSSQARFAELPKNWRSASSAHFRAADALNGYADQLDASHIQAREAVALWERARQASLLDDARPASPRKEAGGVVQMKHTLAFASSMEPGGQSGSTAAQAVSSLRGLAIATLDRARETLEASASEASTTITAAAETTVGTGIPWRNPEPSPSPGPEPIDPLPRSLEVLKPRSTETEEQLSDAWDETVKLMTDEMNDNPEIFSKSTELGTGIPFFQLIFGPAKDHVLRLAHWGLLVKSGARWDHKRQIQDGIEVELGRKSTVEETYLPIPGHEGLNLSHDIWSNIHYGYVGRNIGLTEVELDLQRLVGHDDASDRLSVQIGYELAEKYPPGTLTPEILEQAVIDHLDDYEEACTDRWGDASQLRRSAVE